MQDKVKKGYNKIAKTYSKGRDKFNNDRYLEKLHGLMKPHSTILDIGCGSGKPVATFFTSRGHKVIGLDISKEQVKLAKLNVPSGQFEIRDMSTLSKGEFSVDVVVSLYAIFHIPRELHLEMLKKINSFLPESGLLLITMGSSDWEGSNKDFFGAEMYWSQYGREKNSEIVKEAGFELLMDEVADIGGEQPQVMLGRKLLK